MSPFAPSFSARPSIADLLQGATLIRRIYASAKNVDVLQKRRFHLGWASESIGVI
jgi:hypothetical protein